MLRYLRQRRFCIFSRGIALLGVTAFLGSVIMPGQSYAQNVSLPTPGTMMSLSPGFTPPIIRGMTIDPANPFAFDFIIDEGDTLYSTLQVEQGGGKSDARRGEASELSTLEVEQRGADLLNPGGLGGSTDFRQEASRLIKYFLAALTVPEDQMWVNLSPYEKDRIIPDGFGQTEMGRDLLAQDYILKQLTASLMYPEDELGEKFWTRVRQEASERFGVENIPVETFNKVWIVPEKASVYVHENTVFVVESKLKVLLEEDYVAMANAATSNQKDLAEPRVVARGQKAIAESRPPAGEAGAPARDLTSEIIKDIIIPQLEDEVNHGKNFAPLRQIYNSTILAAWYKQNLKNSILTKAYADQSKTKGVDHNDVDATQKIYNQYLKAFEKGVYNFIREDYDPVTKETVPRKYFSGGADLAVNVTDHAILRGNEFQDRDLAMVTVSMKTDNKNPAMDSKTISATMASGDAADRAMTARVTDDSPGQQWADKLTSWLDQQEAQTWQDVYALWQKLEQALRYLIDNQRGIDTTPGWLTLSRRPSELSDYQYIGGRLRKKWTEKGFDRLIGRLNMHMVLLIAGFPRRETADEVKKVFDRVDYLTKTDDVEDRLLSLWVRAAGYVPHIRAFGPHAEHSRLFDNDDLVKAAGEYLSLLIENKDEIDWKKVLMTLPGAGQEPEFSVTLEHVLLWGLILMMDPMIHNYFLDPLVNAEDFFDKTEAFSIRYPDGPGQMMNESLDRILGNNDLAKVDQLLARAFGMFFDDSLQGQFRRPFDFSKMSSFETFSWFVEQIQSSRAAMPAQDLFLVMMLSFGVIKRHFSDVQRNFRDTAHDLEIKGPSEFRDDRSKYSNGLPNYIALVTGVWADRLPRLTQIFRKQEYFLLREKLYDDTMNISFFNFNKSKADDIALVEWPAAAGGSGGAKTGAGAGVSGRAGTDRAMAGGRVQIDWAEMRTQEEILDAIARLKSEIFRAIVERQGVNRYESTVRLMEAVVAGGYPINIASASRSAKFLLEKAGVMHLIEENAVVDGNTLREENLQPKPAEDMFVLAAQKINITPAGGVAIEDQPAGVRAAIAGGFTVIALDRQGIADELQAAGAHVVLPDLEGFTVDDLIALHHIVTRGAHQGLTNFFIARGIEFDSAMGADKNQTSNIKDQKGGIDLNPANVNLETQGDVIEFNLPPNFEPIEHIDGLYPVIINITPITNLAPLLGLADEDEQQDLSFQKNFEPMDRSQFAHSVKKFSDIYN